MPDQPLPTPVPTVNPAAQQAVDLIEKLTQQGKTVAETAIIAAVPWMGTVIIRQIWEAVFDWLVKLIMGPLAMLGGRVIIRTEEYLALQKVASAQIELSQAKQKGDTNAIQKASAAVDLAVAPVLQYIGSTHS